MYTTLISGVMKKLFVPVLLVPLLMLTVFMSCSKDEYDEITYEANVPVYMSFEEFRASFSTDMPREIEYPGKIYFKDNYLFVNEVNKGIHIINNANPSNPQKLLFYEIPGNVDLAIRGNILFADSYIDLVAIDISSINSPLEVGRLENAFPQAMPPMDKSLPASGIDNNLGVIVGWETRIVTERIAPGSFWDGHWWPWREKVYMDGSYSSADGSNMAGVAGSMARFMLFDQYLYAVTNPFVLKTLDISSPVAIQVVDSMATWRNMETLFRYEDNLFIGTTNGMLIYSLADPAKPSFVSNFDHINACDPVVVANDIAYVTLRTGNACFGNVNQLDVIDIIDIKNPKLLKSYPLFNPHGLGIDKSILFICDGADGLKIYDASNPLAIASNRLAHFPDIDTFDVIPLNDVLMLIGHDGLFQYDYSDPENIRLLSHIVITGDKKK